MADNSTPIGKLGKFGLIDHLTGNLKMSNGSTVAGAGDDCAVIGGGKDLFLITTDLMLKAFISILYTLPSGISDIKQ